MDAASLSYRRLVANVLAGAGGRGAAIGIALVLATVLVRTLGVAAYGTWSFFFVLIGFNAQFDFGLSVAVERAVARAGVDSKDRIAAILNAGFALTVGASALLQVAFAFVPDRWLAPLGEVETARRCLDVLPACLACSNVAAVAGAGLSGLQRTTTLQAQRTLMGGLAAGLVIALTIAGERRPAPLLVAYAAVLLAAGIVAWASVAQRVRPLPLGPWHADRPAFRELTRVAGPLQATTLAAQLGDQGVRLLLGAGFGPAAMGTYDLASRAAIAPRSLMASLLVALVPFAAARERSGGTAALSDSLRRSTRYATLAVGAGTIAALAVAGPLMQIWLGDSSIVDLARQLFILLLISLALQSVLSPMVALGRAAGRPMPETVVTVIAQPVGLALAVPAESALGAVAIVAAVVTSAALVLWVWLRHVLRVEMPPASDLQRLALVVMGTGLTAFAARAAADAGGLAPLATLLVVPALVLVTAAGLALAVGGVTAQERATLVSMLRVRAR